MNKFSCLRFTFPVLSSASLISKCIHTEASPATKLNRVTAWYNECRRWKSEVSSVLDFIVSFF
jgi:hypothetical protein